MNTKRYIVTHPVPQGYAWFRVADTQSDVMPNFEVATFYKDMPGAEAEANDLCERLNAGTGK
jgi:hypothetical protein